jgi:hypothetical protein
MTHNEKMIPKHNGMSFKKKRDDQSSPSSAYKKPKLDQIEEASSQHQSSCGVGAHWQNGVIEHFIEVITTRTCTMLLHAMDQWPYVITAEFWSFAFLHAVWLHNCTPRPGQSESPFTLFTNEDSPLSQNDFKVFGSLFTCLTRHSKTDQLDLENGKTDVTKACTSTMILLTTPVI